MTSSNGGLERIHLDDRGNLVDHTSEEATRIYYDERDEWMGLSVSDIKSYREDADKADAIAGWEQHYDGSSEYKSPHYKEQLAFKQARGTLGHYCVLSQLDNSLEKTDEERSAEALLKNWASERPAMIETDVPYHGDPNAYDGEQAWSKAMRDINWAMEQFESIAEKVGITADSTITVEEYVRNDDVNAPYGGQFDLLFENDNGHTVLADLKFSSDIRLDHKLQLAAYAAACEYDVDELAVIWLSPDKDDATYCPDDEWERSREGLTSEFIGLADRARVDALSQLTFDDIENAVAD
jgi:hypothetical protein